MRARGPRPYEVVIRVWARPVRRGGVSPPDIHVLRARGPRPYENVRSDDGRGTSPLRMSEATNAIRAFGVDLAMNCATTNAFPP